MYFQSSKYRDHFEYQGGFKFKGVIVVLVSFYSAKFKVKATASK
ncbi:hypothetical protein [Campylobacter concisus]|nr:hypothetical protein [Campylobacter concisus]